jgi:hypothetical protein
MSFEGKKIEPLTFEFVEQMDRWPVPALPQDFDERLTIEMIRSGHVRWRMNGAPPTRGWIMLPEEKVR